jgi:dihydrofolate reductase
MNRVIYRTATSFNGYIADEQNSLAWLFEVDHADVEDIAGFMGRVGVMVEGSTTYEWVLAETNVLAEPQKWRELYGDRPTFVFTTRQLPRPQGADVRFVSGDVAASLPEIAAAAGESDVWVVGGEELAGQFLDAGALHEIVLTVAPASLVAGAPLLPRTVGSARLRLTDVRRQGQFAELRYEVVVAPA